MSDNKQYFKFLNILLQYYKLMEFMNYLFSKPMAIIF